MVEQAASSRRDQQMQRDAVRRTIIRIYRRASVIDLADERRMRAKGDPATGPSQGCAAGRSNLDGPPGAEVS
jgi:hypothetical protein